MKRLFIISLLSLSTLTFATTPQVFNCVDETGLSAPFNVSIIGGAITLELEENIEIELNNQIDEEAAAYVYEIDAISVDDLSEDEKFVIMDYFIIDGIFGNTTNNIVIVDKDLLAGKAGRIMTQAFTENAELIGNFNCTEIN